MRSRRHHRSRQWSTSIILILLMLLAAVGVPSALLGGGVGGRTDGSGSPAARASGHATAAARENEVRRT